MQLIIKQQTGKKMIRDIQNNVNNVQFLCTARTIANLIHVNSPGGSSLAR